jgi:PDZ domain-containing protein
MNRRSAATVLAALSLLALLGVGYLLGTPYVLMSPGPTVNVLGETKGEPIVEVQGRRTYPTDGELRLTTVSVSSPGSRVSLFDAMAAWVDPDRTVLPRDNVYPEDRSPADERAESRVQMVGSQDSAVAAAMRELGYDLDTYAEVLGTTPGGPAEDKLEARDEIVSINGTKITRVQQVFDIVDGLDVGDQARFVVLRKGERETATVTTRAAADDPDQAVVGVFVGTGYHFPFEVSVNLSENIGGPSAGLVFALSVYDVLTPGALTGGNDIAGTGTITPAGNVGPIGGIQQKIAAARDVGATVFLVPPANCAAALGVPDTGGVRLVLAPTLHSAVRSLTTYAADPDADLPACPA